MELHLGDDYDIYGKGGTGPASDPSSHSFTYGPSNNNINALAHEATLLASTLDGTLVAMSTKTGEVVWNLNDEPVVKSPYDNSKPLL